MTLLSPEHQLLILLGKEPRRSIKLKYLKKYSRSPKLRNIFDYAVNPFKRFYIKQIPWDITNGRGTRIIDGTTWGILDRLSSRKLSGAEAKQVLFSHMQSLLPSESLLLRKIVLNELGVGVSVQTINAIWPGLIPTRICQKAEDWNPDKLVLPALVSLKLDGIRAEYKDGLFYTRKGRTIPGLSHIPQYMGREGLGSNYDGELLVQGLDFDSASGIIRSQATKRPKVIYTIFDEISIKGILQKDRYGSLVRDYEMYDLRDTPIPPVTYVGHYLMRTIEEIDTFYNNALRLGHEGIMVKNPLATYMDGRNYNWMKRKKGYEGEHEIVDVYEGTKSFKGLLGGVVIRLDNSVYMRVGSGFSEKQRKEWWSAPTEIVGKMGTFTAMEKTKRGRLRHPVFKTIRWDI